MTIREKICSRRSIVGGGDNVTVEIQCFNNRHKMQIPSKNIALIETAICRQFPSAVAYKILESGYEGLLGDKRIDGF